MAVRWTLPFTTIGNKTLTLNIYDASFNGQPTTLIGAAKPFVTDNGNDDDFMLPVRYSTGNIHIINTGTRGEANIMPTTPKARPVELVDEHNDILWQGYIKQEQFSQPWSAVPYQIDFPVVSPLGILSGYKIKKGNVTERARVAQYILSALNLSGGSYYSIVYPNELGEDSEDIMNVMFRIGIQDRTWFEYKNENVLDKTESRYDGVSWLTLLSSLMESFGYTLYDVGTTIFIISRTTSSYSVIQKSALSTLAENNTPTINAYSTDTYGLSALQIADSSGEQSITPPSTSVALEAEIKKFDSDSTPQIDSKYLAFAMITDINKYYGGQQSSGAYFSDRVGLYEPVSGQAVWTFKEYIGGNETTWSAQDILQDCHMGVFCRELSGNDIVLITFNNTQGSTGSGGTWTVACKSPTQNMFAGGSIVLKGKVFAYEGEGAATNHRGVFALRCGDKYYDGENHTWSSTFQSFECSIGSSGDIGAISSPEMGDEDGYYMKLPDNGIFGDVELFFFDPRRLSVHTQLEAVFEFSEIKIDYVAPAEDIFKDTPVTDTNRFVADLQTFGTEEITKNIPITSYINNRIGYGVLLSPDFSKPLGKIYINGYGEAYFEQNIIRACQALYNNPQTVLNVPIKQFDAFIPTDKFSYSGTFKYLSSEIDWIDEKQTVRMYK